CEVGEKTNAHKLYEVERQRLKRKAEDPLERPSERKRATQILEEDERKQQEDLSPQEKVIKQQGRWQSQKDRLDVLVRQAQELEALQQFEFSRSVKSFFDDCGQKRTVWGGQWRGGSLGVP
ncbi:unnamed protein product, partial [Polarella glacialis]